MANITKCELCRRTIHATEEAANDNIALSGRQALHIVYAYFVTDQQAAAVNNLEDILAVTFHGDQQSETILDKWDPVLVGTDSIPAMEALYTPFFRQR